MSKVVRASARSAKKSLNMEVLVAQWLGQVSDPLDDFSQNPPRNGLTQYRNAGGY